MVDLGPRCESRDGSGSGGVTLMLDKRAAWRRIIGLEGETFTQMRGGDFTFAVVGGSLRLDRTTERQVAGCQGSVRVMVESRSRLRSKETMSFTPEDSAEATR